MRVAQGVEHACLPLLESPTQRVVGSPELNVRGRSVQGFWMGKKPVVVAAVFLLQWDGTLGRAGWSHSGLDPE